MPKQFSACIKRSDEKNGERLYVDGLKMRCERCANGQVNITILRPDKKVEWTFWPKDKTYLRTKLPKALIRALNNPDSVWDPDSLFNWEYDGTKMIDGRKCLCIHGKPLEKAGRAHEIRFVDTKTGMYRRIITFNKLGKKCLTVDYLDVVIGPPDPAMFEILTGYKRVN